MSWEAAVSNRKDRMKIKVWRLAEASAEGPLGIVGLLAACTIVVAGAVLGWW